LTDKAFREKYLSVKVTNVIVTALWSVFFLSLVFLIDVKLSRYKLAGMNLSLLSLLGIWVLSDLEVIKDLRRKPLIAAVIVWVLTVSVFYVFSPDKPTAYSQWQRIIFSAAAFISAYRVFPDRNKNLLLNIIILSAAVISLYGLLQKTGGVWIVRVPEMERIYATFGNPNFFASFLIGLIPLTAAYTVQKVRIWKAAALVLMLLALYHTGTRGAWAGLLGSGLLWWFVKERKKRRMLVTFLFFMIISGCIYLTRNVWLRQLDRLLIWRDTIGMFIKNPLFGVGLGEFHNVFPSYASDALLRVFPRGKFIVNYAHNEFLEILSETGIAGFGFYIWFLAAFYYSALRAAGKSSLRMGALCGVTAILIQSGVSVNMRFAVASIWAFFLMGFSVRSREDIKLPSGSAGKTAAAGVFFLLLLWGKQVIDPLIAHKKLSAEVDFFDTEREYSEQELKQIIEKQPGNADAYYKLGWIQAKNKEFQQAISNFKKAVAIDDSLVGVYNNLGNIYFTMGNRQEAAKYYIEAIKRRPSLIDPHFNLGVIYYYQGMLEEATREFNIVLKLDPDNYKAKIMLKKMVE